MTDFRLAPARPRQSVIIAADLRIVLGRAHRHKVELVLVLHMRFQALRRLTAIAGRPTPAVHLAQHILRHRPVALDSYVLEHPVGEAELLREQVNDLIVVLLLEARLDDLLAPLDRPVGSDARAGSLELRADRQEIGVVLTSRLHRERRPGRRVRIGDHEQFQARQTLHGFRDARDAVAGVTLNEHRPQAVSLLDILFGQQDRIEPSGQRNAGRLHDFLGVELGQKVLIRNFPDPRPVLPCAFRQPVVEGQGHHIQADVGRTLHIIVAAEDIGARAGFADIAGGQAQYAARADIGGSNRMMGLSHAPDDRRGLLGGEHLGDAFHLVARHAGDALHLVGRVFGDLLADFVHPVDALRDEFLIFPAILEDMPEQSPENRDVRARPDACELGGMRGGAGEPRIHHDEVRVVEFLAFEQVLHGDRMRLRRVPAEDEHRLGIADVVERIGHRAVAPGIGHAGDGR